MYLINEVSRKVNLSQKRIREYEKEGFVKPERAPYTNNRLYSDFDIDQIKRVHFLIHQRGFTLACLKNLLLLAPCWKIFGCQDYETCPAFLNPHEPCWKVRMRVDKECMNKCERCPVYNNRDIDAEKLLEKEDRRW